VARVSDGPLARSPCLVIRRAAIVGAPDCPRCGATLTPTLAALHVATRDHDNRREDDCHHPVGRGCKKRDCSPGFPGLGPVCRGSLPVAVHESRVPTYRKEPKSDTGHDSVGGNGMGRPRLRVGGERFSRPRFSGKVSDWGAANGGTHFSRPYRQAAGGRTMNCQFRARLMLRTKWLRCRRTEAG